MFSDFNPLKSDTCSVSRCHYCGFIGQILSKEPYPPRVWG